MPELILMIMAFRHCVFVILWDYPQALGLLQHVSSYTINNEIPLSSSCTAVRELYLHLPRFDTLYGDSQAINWFIRYRARRRGQEVADELPYSYQAMLFWAGLRGAVGVALAAGLEGNNGPALRATVLVVVVLTVIIFGGATARML